MNERSKEGVGREEADVEEERLLERDRETATRTTAKLVGRERNREATMKVCGGRVETKVYNIWTHGAAFMVLFSAFQTASEYAQPILSELGHENLGFTSNALVYLTLSMSNLVAPMFVTRHGAVNSMIYASSMYQLYLMSFVVPFSFTILLTSVSLGFGAAIIWTAQAVFLSENSDPARRGRDSGIFWALLQMRLFVGNAIAYVTMSGEESGPVTPATARSFFFGMVVLGCMATVLFCSLPRSVRTKTTAPSIRTTVRLMYEMMHTERMSLLAVASAYTGLLLTFWSGKYFTMVSGHMEPDDIALPDTFSHTLVAVAGIAVGAGEVLGGVGFGRVADKYGRTYVAALTFAANMVAMILVSTVVYSLKESGNDRATLMLIAGFCLGLCDSGISTLMYALVAESYVGDEERTVSAFAIVKLTQSLACAAAFLCAGKISLSTQIFVLVVAACIGCACVVRVDGKLGISG